MADQKLFKELEIGFRELFRILIPGAYVVSLAQVIAPDAAFTQRLVKDTASGVAATFFLGLIGYALRVHERWLPYFWYFEKQRVRLNDEIARVASVSRERDNVDFYKYFLETSADNLSDRIHYFTSFYYMLLELSLFSAAAAYVLVAQFLFKAIASVSPIVVKLAVCSIALACIIQLTVLFALSGIKTVRTKRALVAEPLLGILALVIMILSGFWKGVLSVHILLCGIGLTPAILLTASYLFWRLGEKHWKQVIGEQVTLVNDHAKDLVELGGKCHPTPSPGSERQQLGSQPTDANGS
jgi:hypothetical protein